MANTVTLTFSSKTLNQAARMQERFIKQLEVLGFQLSEFKAIPAEKKVMVTMTLVRKKI